MTLQQSHPLMMVSDLILINYTAMQIFVPLLEPPEQSSNPRPADGEYQHVSYFNYVAENDCILQVLFYNASAVFMFCLAWKFNNILVVNGGIKLK